MTESGQELAPFLPQPSDSKGVKGNRDSKENDIEAGDVGLENNNEVQWIQHNIKMRKCALYVPSDDKELMQHFQKSYSRIPNPPDGKKIICQCGYHNEDHLKISLSPRKPTNAFGEIEFVGFGGNIGKFVRVDEETSKSTMLELMTKVWGMEKPNVLISVTGGAKYFNMKPRLRDVFRHGLIKAAHSTGAWIITGGTHVGVMKHVGEAVRDNVLTSTNQKPVVAIGIAPWGVIQNRNVLVNKEGSWPAEYRIEENENQNESFLDPNHSHFILVDNGTQHKHETEIRFRAELERKISEMPTDTGNDAVSVPIVILVLEGGLGTLKTVQKALEENTPAVIVKGSGRAADILAYAFKYAEIEEIDAKDDQGRDIKITRKQMKQSLKDDIHKQMKDMNFCKEEMIPDNIKQIEDCLAKSELIHIFEWDSGTGVRDIDKAMLKALLKAKKNQVMNQLKLALVWNRIDIAKSEIFTDDKRWATGSLDDIMLSAIQQNRVKFVELFLDNGVSLKEFLTIKRLEMLYNNGSPQSLFKILLNKMWREKDKKHNEEITLNEVVKLTQYLLRDYDLPHCISEPRYANNDVVESPDRVQSENKAKKQKPDFENPEQLLFIWSVLNANQEMAKLFWLHGKDVIAAALVANALLYAMLHRADDKKLIARIKADASEFMNLAIGVLDECHSTDEIKARHLLIRELSQWGKTSCVLIAVKAHDKMQFISQTACQDLFNNIWMGEMTQENGTLRLLICIAIPLLIPLLAKFKEMKDGEHACVDATTNSRVQKSRGKPYTSVKQSPSSKHAQETDHPADERKVDANNLKIGKKFLSFYRAPVVKFFHNVISYMIFLGLYSYILISKLEEKLSVEEMLLIVWVFTIFTEEINQVATTSTNASDSMALRKRLLQYITDGWNTLDIISLSLFVIGMILRGIPHAQTFEVARIFLGVNLVTFFMRLLHIYSVHKELGPQLVMIIRMVRNMTYFVVILLVFIVAYAIASHAILYPNTELSLDTFIAIFRRPYWNIYGDLMLDEIEGTADCTNDAELYRNGTYSRCPTVSGKYFVPVLLAVYMLMSNILLLNLLIAIFSYTFQMVQDNAEMHWCFQRYRQINEYYNRPLLAHPFTLVEHVLQLIRFVVRKLGFNSKSDSSASGGSAFLERVSNETELCKFEENMADTFHDKRDRELADLDSIKNSRLDQLVKKIDELQEQQHAGIVTIENAQSNPSQIGSLSEQKCNTGTEPGLTDLAKSMEDMNKQLNSIVGMLQQIMESPREQQLGAKKASPEVTDARI